ncbi:helix-turn-helix domain-containing protein [Oceanobacillus kapialis]|uniref:helix-turn-helix domain-containing protein n=1 Tax=Oceanobacillus kapialis TaxID=481353 RepID=UPI003850F847
MLLKGIVLACCSRLSTDRTESAIYHIITGKKSVQTVQDIHLYKITKYYSIHKKLDRTAYNRTIAELSDEGLLTQHSSTFTLEITEKGKSWLLEQKDRLPFHYFNGLKYKDAATIFLDRLTLLVQTFSNVAMKHFSFIPVVDNPLIESWVKDQYKLQKDRLRSYLEELHNELFEILQKFKEEEASIFIDRLSGHQYYGMSWEQLAKTYHMRIEDSQLYVTGISHAILEQMKQTHDSFPLLSNMVVEGTKKRLLTDSAYKTSELLHKNYSMEDIAIVRNLRINTIQDHVVEIALYQTDFPIERYVPLHIQEDILQAIEKAASNKLKEIKGLTEKETSYFQIRLLIACYKNIQQVRDISV